MRGSWRLNKDCNILTPTLMAISVVSFSFSWCSTGGQGAHSAGFLYCILSPTGLVSKLHRGSRGPLRAGVAFLTPSRLQLVWSPTPWLPVSPSYIIVQSPTQSPTKSLEWHVWSSSRGNNCHAVQRSLSSGASVYECIMGFYLVPFRQPNPPTRFLSITGHCNVSLPSGASLWNGMPGRIEGQNTTYLEYYIVEIVQNTEETWGDLLLIIILWKPTNNPWCWKLARLNNVVIINKNSHNINDKSASEWDSIYIKRQSKAKRKSFSYTEILHMK